jgi:hypothetical protein
MKSYFKLFAKTAGGWLRALAELPKRDPALIVVAAVFAAAVIMALGGVSSGWLSGTGGRIGAQKSIQARNYLKFGYVATRLAPLGNAGPARDASGKPAPHVLVVLEPQGIENGRGRAFLPEHPLDFLLPWLQRGDSLGRPLWRQVLDHCGLEHIELINDNYN